MRPTLILSPRRSAEALRMADAARRAGWQVVQPERWELPHIPANAQVAVYAESLFAAWVTDQLGIPFPEAPDEWLPSLPPHLLRRDVRGMRLSQARALEGTWFVKPTGFKSFKAAVYTTMGQLPGEEAASGDEPVLVSEVVRWQSEFRFFLLDGLVQTGSVYFRHGDTAEVEGQWPSDPKEYAQAKAVAEEAARHGKLPRGIVIDTGYIERRGWAVIEANPAWGSGLYGSDPDQVLPLLLHVR